MPPRRGPVPVYEDTWPSLPSSVIAKHGLPSPANSERASRFKGITNEVAYPAFHRALPSGLTTTFRVGDTVIIGPGAVARQPWLSAPDYLVDRGRRKKARKWGWENDDGLGLHEKAGTIVSLFEDVNGNKLSKIRWFARPASLWGEDGPDDGEVLLPRELYYTTDSTFVRECPPWCPGQPARSSIDALKTPLCTDTIPIVHIVRHIQILSATEAADIEAGADEFIVRKVYDTKPLQSGEFIGEIDWSEVHEVGMKRGLWDTAPIGVQEEERDDEEDEMETGRVRKRKATLTPNRPRKKTAGSGRRKIADSDEEDDDDEPSRKASPYKKVVVPKMLKTAVVRAENKARKRDKFQQKLLTASTLPSAFIPPPDFKRKSPFEQAKQLLHVSATPERLPCREDQRSKITSLLGDAIINETGTCLYIHGVPGTGKTATVHSVVRELQQDEDMEPFKFVEINGMKISEPNTAFTILWEALSGKKAPPRQALTHLDHYFKHPGPSHQTTVVLVDELDQMLTKKQDVIYNFFNWPHVNHSRLIVIAVANTMDLPERELSGKIQSRLGSNRIPFPTYSWRDLHAILRARLGDLEVFDPPALERIAKSVAAASGDARRVLDIARRTVEKKEQNNRITKERELCGMADVAETYKEMTNYGSNAFVKAASLHQKLFLYSLSAVIKRAGTTEVELESVVQYHLDFLRQRAMHPIPSHADLFAIAADLHGLRLLATESQRADYFQRIRPMVADPDLFVVLAQDEVLKRHMPKLS